MSYDMTFSIFLPTGFGQEFAGIADPMEAYEAVTAVRRPQCLVAGLVRCFGDAPGGIGPPVIDHTDEELTAVGRHLHGLSP